jgi:two-component system chemotaxis response regulator CheB
MYKKYELTLIGSGIDKSFSDGIVLFFQNESGFKSRAFYLSSKDADQIIEHSDFSEWLDSSFKNDASAVSLKVIGSEKYKKVIEENFFFTKYKQEKYVSREGSYHLIYDAKGNNLKVSIAETVHVPAKSKEIIFSPEKRTKPIRVLIVDDSKTMISLLTSILKKDPMIEVVGSALSPLSVEQLIIDLKPDVMTFDIHMPELTGVELLKKTYPKYKIPTIIITSIGLNEGTLVLEAMEHGAFDYIQKPRMDELEDVSKVIMQKIHAAAEVDTKILGSTPLQLSTSTFKKPTMAQNFQGALDSKLILIGSSTGGTNALTDMLKLMPKEIPPMVIVQHIPPVFSAAFARRLDELCPFHVKESEDGDKIVPNQVIVAKGGVQLKIVRKGKDLYIQHTDDEPVNRFKPSVDYMFNSAAECLIKETTAVILTGMGNDGSKGMLKLLGLGASTIAQNKETSVVFGMPREAIQLGAAQYVEALLSIPNRLTQIFNQSKKKKVS